MAWDESTTTLVTWSLAFGGWFAVHKATLSRERRKEKREAAKEMCLALRTLERSAIDFHTAEEYSSRAANDLRQDTERLILQLQRKPLSELQIPLSRMIQFRRSVSRHNIDPSDFLCQLPDSDLIREVRNAVTDVIESIEERREQYWA
jgi:hypothetical protein